MTDSYDESFKYEMYGITINRNLVIQDTNPPLMPSKYKDTESQCSPTSCSTEYCHSRQNQITEVAGTIYRQRQISENGNPVTENSINGNISVEESKREVRGNDYNLICPMVTCNICTKVLAQMLSEDTKEFWTRIENTWPDPVKKCHVKCFDEFLQQLRNNFPKERGLNSKRIVNLMQHVLNVNNKEDMIGGVKLNNLNRAINLFGPIRNQEERCVFVQQMCNIIEESSKVRSKDASTKTSWFLGHMSRSESEEALLKQHCKDKTFLIRISGSDGDNGDFVLSVKHEDHCHHLKIQGNPEKALKSSPYHAHLEFAGQEFPSLPEVVEYIALKQDIPIATDDDDIPQSCKVVTCFRVFTKSPLNGIICGYQKARR